MPIQIFPFAIRLIGFSEQESETFDASFARPQGKGYRYFRLEEDNLQDPDLYIAKGGDLRALVILADLRPSNARPALLVGSPLVELPYPRVEHPIHWRKLFEALDDLVEKRADALSRLKASGTIGVPERRRRNRLDLDLTDPAEYVKMRAPILSNGEVLVVDKNPVLSDYLSDLLVRHPVPVVWAGSQAEALELCEQRPISVVLLNTSTPGVEPYHLCRKIKEKDSPVKIKVIFLVSKPFVYAVQLAHQAGADGFLNKPLASHHLVTVLKKFLPQKYKQEK